MSFNTAFIPKNNEIKFTKYEVGPDKLHENNKVIDDNFSITLEFDDND